MQGPVYILFIIFLSSLPIILSYLYLRQRSPQFSIYLFLIALALGGLSLLLGSLLQALLPVAEAGNRLSLLYTVFFRNAFTEELGRFCIFLIVFPLMSKMTTSKSLITIVPVHVSRERVIYLGVLAGFTFAMLETLSYGLFDLQIIILRTLTSAPLHAACAARVALAAYLTNTKALVKALFYGFSAILIHGIYNLLLLFPSALGVLPVLLAYVALASVVSMAKTKNEVLD